MSMKYLSETLLRALEQRTPAARACTPLEAARIGLKVFFTPKSAVEPEAIIAAFRRWIREHALPGDLAIDVVTSRGEGSSMMLIGADAFYAVDGRSGLRYVRRRTTPGSGYASLLLALEATLSGAKLLEQDAGVRFGTDVLELEIDDRLVAPNTQETFAYMSRVLGPIMLQLFDGGAIEPASGGDPRAAFRVRMHGVRERPLDELINLLSWRS